jgi:hypothetical protein
MTEQAVSNYIFVRILGLSSRPLKTIRNYSYYLSFVYFTISYPTKKLPKRCIKINLPTRLRLNGFANDEDIIREARKLGLI